MASAWNDANSLQIRVGHPKWGHFRLPWCKDQSCLRAGVSMSLLKLLVAEDKDDVEPTDSSGQLMAFCLSRCQLILPSHTCNHRSVMGVGLGGRVHCRCVMPFREEHQASQQKVFQSTELDFAIAAEDFLL